MVAIGVYIKTYGMTLRDYQLQVLAQVFMILSKKDNHLKEIDKAYQNTLRKWWENN